MIREYHETKVHITFECSICSKRTDKRESLRQCEATPESHPALYFIEETKKEGFSVTLWEAPWWRIRDAPLEQMRYTALPYYSLHNNHMVGPRYPMANGHKFVPLHTLCVELRKNLDEDRPWKPGDTSYASHCVTWDDMLILKNGNREEMIAACLLPPQKKPFFLKSLLDRLLNY